MDKASVEPIAKEVLDAAHLKWCRHVASAIIAAMGETGATYRQLDAAIGKPDGFTKRWLNKYIEGNTKEGRDFTDLCAALQGEPRVQLRIFRPATPNDAQQQAEPA